MVKTTKQQLRTILPMELLSITTHNICKCELIYVDQTAKVILLLVLHPIDLKHYQLVNGKDSGVVTLSSVITYAPCPW